MHGSFPGSLQFAAQPVVDLEQVRADVVEPAAPRVRFGAVPGPLLEFSPRTIASDRLLIDLLVVSASAGLKYTMSICGIRISQPTVGKYMRRRSRPLSQTWRTFLTNHLEQITAADFCVVPTVTGRVLFVLVLLAHTRRRVVPVAATPHPTAPWTHPTKYVECYERSRTHLSLDKDAPASRPVSPASAGPIIAIPEVNGLHHRYERHAA